MAFLVFSCGVGQVVGHGLVRLVPDCKDGSDTGSTVPIFYAQMNHLTEKCANNVRPASFY